MNKLIIQVIIVFVTMVSASVASTILRPTHKIAKDGDPIVLETLIPKQFSGWHEIELGGANIVNPQQKEEIERIYSQTLSRTYVNDKGEYVMLSIAYGEDQSDSNQLHLPDVCYPAQGFQVKSSSKDTIATAFGAIQVKKLLTVLGTRSEPLTYWTTVGDKVAIGGKAVKLEQLKYGFNGKIPDGMIVRVSTITLDEQYGFDVQQRFIQDVVASLNPQDRQRVAGLHTGIE
ncbi:EpsI family protein [Methylobacillus caricis]|uniref:exosortase-associated protein EpsI, B-type n=1 Tax=Methylobacillus caricis TaxID=1971611 RepID=UPI001D0017CB|nr:exosortase-associated protein EpsI, B-type [Methylobacillus caricis]MCB5188081.1 EpsI family protein [Methylobacillus caricis]